MRLTPELLRDLRAEAGEELLQRAEALAGDPFAAAKLRRHAPEDLAAAAVEQVLLRRRAAGKFSRAAEMWFAPSLLEQSSGEIVSRCRAARFASIPKTGSPVGDFCCGLGADAVVLAERGPVVAVDRDPLALALTRANAEVLGVAERLEVRDGVIPADAPPAEAAWVDPGRREGSARTRRLDGMSPTLAEVLSLLPRTPNLGVKLSPAADDAELDAALAGIRHEREFLSVAGECRELALWLGGLAGAEPRRATVLPAGAELAGCPVPYGEIRPFGEWLVEPDPAVIRAGLVGNLAVEIGAWPVDRKLAYLSCAEPRPTPFGVLYRVEPPEAFSLRKLGERLRAMGAGDAVFKTRGSALQPEVLRQQLRGVLKQGRPVVRPVVFVTRLEQRAVMIVGERFGAASD